MYALARSRNDSFNGRRKYSVTERRYESRRTGGKYFLNSGDPIDLDLEPELAKRLDALNPDQLENKVAILTVGVTEAGYCGLVAAAILQETYPRLRSGRVPDMEYWTLAVSPDGVKRVKGDDKDWETERMHKLARYYKGYLRAQVQMWENLQMSQIQAQMSSIWSNVMREAAVQDAQTRSLQRRLGGR